MTTSMHYIITIVTHEVVIPIFPTMETLESAHVQECLAPHQKNDALPASATHLPD